MPEKLELALLGNPEIRCDGVPVTDLKSSKAQALLCYLAVTSRPHTRPPLAGLLWGDMPEARARMNLSQALTTLRRFFGDHLSITRQTVAFERSSDTWLDVEIFEQQIADSRWQVADSQWQVADRPSAISHLQSAISLYRGDFLDGLHVRNAPEFELWVLTQRARLRELALQALRTLAAHHAEQGEAGWAAAIDYTARLLTLEPWQEEAHCELMRLLALSGRRSAALVQYERCRQILADELGVEPAMETTVLYERIRDGELTPGTAPSEQATHRHNLPAQTTPFIGRETELVELAGLLADPAIRLVTIYGAGGMGKTRLAIETGFAQLEHFDHGVYFVPLAPLDNPTQVAGTIAETLGFSFHEGRNQQQQLLDYLRPKSLLLVMDNFEHLLPDTALVTNMLQAAPGLKILVTSRSRLNLQGEQLFPIGGIDVPQKAESPAEAIQSGAVELFVQSARRVQHDFVLTDENLQEVVQICRLVEGMPLAILLAAAWIETIPPARIEREITQGLDFLEMQFQDVPRRHWSIRAVFDHSWKLMTEQEQQIFQALSVFRGGFTHQAAQEVTQISLQALRSFVNKSLLNHTATDRYQIHELLRQYAADELNQTPAAYESARDAHCAYYSAFLHRWASDLKTARRLTALEAIRTERDNARAAWNWAIAQGQWDRLEQAMEGLAAFYQWQGRYQEGEEALRLLDEQLVVSNSGEEQHLRARALIWQANFNRDLGRTRQATHLLQQSLDLLASPDLSGRDTRIERADALYCLGSTTLRHDYEKARDLWQQSCELYRAAGDQWGMSHVLGYLSMIAWELGQYDEAKGLVQENLAIQQAIGSQVDIGNMFSTLGWINLTQGYFQQAEQLAQKCTVHYRETGDRAHIAKGLRDLAAPKIFLGRFNEANALLEESVALFNELGGGGDLVFTNILLGATKAHLGQYGEARDREEFALKLAQQFEDRAGEGRARLWLGRIALAEAAYAEAHLWLQEATAIFREVGQKDQLGASLASLGYSSRAVGDLAGAHNYLVESLQTAIEIGAFIPLLFAIPLAALLAADRGERKRAVELYTLASHYAFVADSRWCNDVFGQHISNVATALPPEAATAAQGREQARDLWAAAKAVIRRDREAMPMFS
ncbi:MAG: BTAD domain-containing putative transcriptional regulator [Anaerolineae bacterium]